MRIKRREAQSPPLQQGSMLLVRWVRKRAVATGSVGSLWPRRGNDSELSHCVVRVEESTRHRPGFVTAKRQERRWQ